MTSTDGKRTDILDDVSVSTLVMRVTPLVGGGELPTHYTSVQTKFEAINVAPQNNHVGSPGDLTINVASPSLWIKTSGIRTKTGWTQIGAGGGGGTLTNTAPTGLSAGATSSVGTSTEAARGDHTHAVPVAVPVAASGVSNAVGSSTSFVRSDHVHRTEIGVFLNGSSVGSRPRINFSGTGLTVVDDATNDRVNVTFTGGSSGPSAGGAASTLSAGASSSAGSSANYSREDHVHAVPVATAVAISANANAAGTSTSLARADHTHQITSNAPGNGQVPTWNGSAWVAQTVTVSGIPTAGGAPGALSAGSTGAAGTSSNFSRSDHAHAVPVATAVAISGNANAAGSSTSLSRADHTHALTTATPSSGQVPQWNGSAWIPANTSGFGPTAGGAPGALSPDATSASGSSTSYARQDHVHAVPAAAAVSISENTNAEGSSTSFSRADHTHQLTTATPSNGQVPQWSGSAWVASTLSIPSAGGVPAAVTAGASGAAGSSTSFARQDHVHAVGVATAVSISANANAEGSASTFSRSDHTHQLTTTTPTNGQVPQWNGSAWAPASISVPSAGGAATGLTAGSSSAAGTSTAYSRADHAHAVPVATAVSISSNSSAEGSSTSLSRADHTHALTSSTPSSGQVPAWNGSSWAPISLPSAGGVPAALAPDGAASAGTSTAYARQDHVHATPAATAVAISGNANAEGSSTSFSRADHTHQLTANTPSNGQVPQWNGTAWVATTASAAGNWNAVLTAGNVTGAIDPVLSNGQSFRGVDGASPTPMIARGGNGTGAVTGASATFSAGSGGTGGAALFAGGDSISSSNPGGAATLRGGNTLVGGGATDQGGYVLAHGGDAPATGASGNGSGGNFNARGGIYRTGIAGAASTAGGVYVRSGQPDTSAGTTAGTTGPIRITTAAIGTVGDMASTSGTQTDTGSIQIDTNNAGSAAGTTGNISISTGSVNATTGNNPGDISFTAGAMLRSTQSFAPGGGMTVTLGNNAGQASSPGGSGTFTAGSQTNTGSDNNSPGGSWTFICGNSGKTSASSPAGTFTAQAGNATNGGFAGHVDLTAGTSSNNDRTGRVRTATDGVTNPKEDRTLEFDSTDASQTNRTLFTLASAGHSAYLDVEVNAQLQSGTFNAALSRKISAGYFRTSSAVVEATRHINGTASIGAGSGWSADVVISGNDVILRCIGAASTNIRWSIKMDYKARL